MTFVRPIAEQCLGKVVFQTKKDAKRAISRHRRMRQRDSLTAYRCPHCNQFHIGGTNHVASPASLHPHEEAAA